MKVGILGAGAMGRTVIGHLQKCSTVTNIVAYDTSAESLEQTRRECGVEGSLSLERTLDDPNLKLVFITAANAAHKDLALAALQAGKAVMCEKPMATSLADAAAMAGEAERLNAFLQIGFELRYSWLYSTVKKWIDEGKLGEVRNIQCNYICGEFWGRESWRAKMATGGSMFGEKLSHYVDLPRWWTGARVEEVYALSSPNVVSYYEVRDNYQASCKFANGTVSHLTFFMPFSATSLGDPLLDLLDQQKDDGHELRFLVMGTEGAAETNVFRRTLKRWAYRETAKGFHSEIAETIHWQPEKDHFYFHNTHDQTQDIVRRVQEGLPPSISPRDALETMKVCEAADLSVERSQAIQIETLSEASGFPS